MARTLALLTIGLALAAGAAHAQQPVYRQEHIADPVLNMTAYDVGIPTGWTFEGAFMAGSSCSTTPFPVFRATAPDGLTELRRLPRLDWWFTNGPFAGSQHDDCLPLREILSAADFLKYLVGVMQVAYVGEWPIKPELLAQQKQQLDALNEQSRQFSSRMNGQAIVQTGDIAAVRAEYMNGTVAMEEQLRANVLCSRLPLPAPIVGPGQGRRDLFTETCNASVRVIRAPKGRLDEGVAWIDSHPIGAAENAAWVSAYIQASQQRSSETLRQQGEAFSRAQAQRNEDFQRAQAMRQRQHEQFLATMREGTDRALARARQASGARHTAATDWADYALDQQTVTGPYGTGKVPSTYNHTWVNQSGQYFQTNNPNADPNGSLTGTWTLQTRVHGEGTPY